MAAEPSAFGAKLRFYADSPPSIEPLIADLEYWVGVKPADPRQDGLMPLVLRLYEVTDECLHAEGLTSMMPLMMGLLDHADEVSGLLATVTTSIIHWLHAQLEVLRASEGVMLLDDVVGMVSKRHYQTLIQPHLRRIFDEFEGLIRVYHNDTPCSHLLESLAEASFDVFNFSHETDIAEVKAKMERRVALMGNVPPLDVGVRGTPEDVMRWARQCLDRGAPGGGMILSFGRGVSSGT